MIIKDVSWNTVQLAVSGDQLAMEEIYRSCYERVFKRAVLLVKNTEKAQDLVNDTFVKIFEKLSTFRGESKLTTWIDAVETNIFIMSIRSKRVEISLDSVWDPTMKNSEACEVISILSMATEDINAIDPVVKLTLCTALSRLPKDYFQAVYIRDIQGCSIKEAAEILGISKPNLKTRHLRAKKVLKEILSGEEIHARKPSRTARKVTERSEIH